MERHSILGNKVKLYRRIKGGSWHCYTFFKGKEWRQSTKEKSLALAKEVAEDWYLELCANPITPREWFLVPLFAIDEAVEKIKDGALSPIIAMILSRHL